MKKQSKMKKVALVCALSLSTVTSMATLVNVRPISDMGIVSTVQAAEKGTITIKANVGDNGKVQSLAGKKFKIYKLFDAQNAKGKESINYTMNPKYEEALKQATGKDSEYAVIDYIQSLNNNLVVNDVTQTQVNESRYSNFRYFVENLRDIIIEKGLADTMTVTIPNNITDNYTLDVAYGYYIIDEVTSVSSTHSAASLCLVNTVNQDITINIKSDYPVIQKQIREDDDRDNIGADKDGWNDVGDYEIGQIVPYRYLTSVPNINGYDKYYFAMHDRMDEELTFNEKSVVVKIGNHVLTNNVDYKVVTTKIPADETFQIQISDLKATVNKYFYAGDHSVPESEKVYGQKIVVEYNATLNEKAQLDTGRPGFENDVKLEFSNNPDSDGTGSTGETPWDTVVAFTFRMDGIKVNDQTPEVKLEGAKFRLYSDIACTQEVFVKKGQEEGSYVVINRDTAGTIAPAEAVEMISNEEGIFNIIGLDSQTYYLKETKAPDGYRLLKDPIILHIQATYGEDNRTSYIKGDGATDKTLQKLEATAHFKEFYTGQNSEYDNNLNTDVETGAVDLKVVNQVGSKLPATGSMMTIAFVGIGSAIMVTVFVKNRKKETE